MIVATVLERMLVTERERQRETLEGSLAFPGIHERVVSVGTDPIVVTNARGTFVQTKRRASDGVARTGFSDVPLEREGDLLAELYRVLWKWGAEQNWPNRCSTIAQARERLVDARMLTISETLLETVVGDALTTDDVSKLMAAQGYVVEVDGLRVLAGGLPDGAAMLSVAPVLLGFYTRTGEWLGIQIHRADRSILLVGDDVG